MHICCVNSIKYDYEYRLSFQENKIKEELEKKIEKLREQADISKQEIDQGKIKIDEVIYLRYNFKKRYVWNGVIFVAVYLKYEV